MIFRQFVIASLFLLALHTNAQECEGSSVSQDWLEEVLHYRATYKWGLLWAEAGAVTFSVKDTSIAGKDLYSFYSYGTSLPKWDWFFKVRSTYESITNETFEPQSFTRRGQEGSNHYYNHYVFAGDSATIRQVNKDGIESNRNIAISECAMDVVSAIYYCRSLDFASKNPDEVIPLEMVMDGRVHQSYVKYKGIVDVRHPDQRERIPCFHFRPLLMEGSVFKAGENMDVYVTADDRKIPVYVRTGLRVGHARIWLKNLELLETAAK